MEKKKKSLSEMSYEEMEAEFGPNIRDVSIDCSTLAGILAESGKTPREIFCCIRDIINYPGNGIVPDVCFTVNIPGEERTLIRLFVTRQPNNNAFLSKKSVIN